MLLVSACSLYSQANTIETVFQSSTDFATPTYTEGYIYFTDFEGTAYRINNGNIDRVTLPENEENCRFLARPYYYKEAAYFNYEATNDCQDNKTYKWAGSDFVEDIQIKEEICASYKNLLLIGQPFTDNISVLDIETNTNVPLIGLDKGEFTYTLANICELNNTYVKLKAFKVDKATGDWVADAIIVYNWKTHDFNLALLMVYI